MQYLEGIDRDLVHKVYLLKMEAKRNGHPKTSMLTILNAVLHDALQDMDALRARFCTPKEVACPNSNSPASTT